MSLSCYCGEDTDGADWWWYEPLPEKPLNTKRGRKCRSCGSLIKVGDTAREVRRYRPPTGWEEMKGIADDEVPLASWYLCESCGDLESSIREAGFCYSLDGESLRDQVAEFRAMQEGETE